MLCFVLFFSFSFFFVCFVSVLRAGSAQRAQQVVQRCKEFGVPISEQMVMLLVRYHLYQPVPRVDAALRVLDEYADVTLSKRYNLFLARDFQTLGQRELAATYMQAAHAPTLK